MILFTRLKRILPLLAGALFFFILGGIVLSKSFQNSTIPEAPPSPQVKSEATEVEELSNAVKVLKVIDGDTITLEGGVVLRYIGIDTPETKDPRTSVQCFGEKASEENKRLVEGKMVRLEKDISETDRYGRLLRYVYVDDPSTDSGQAIFVNDYLVKEGFAHASSYPPDVKYQSLFTLSEAEARTAGKGLWSECKIPNTTTSPSPSANPVTLGATSDSNINCSQNTYNCSSFKTQPEAQNVFDNCGGTSNDVHKLDRDGDGRVCETLP